ncbi:hypothetical protein [Streptomyces rubiginosohelvolus]|uniref:hypothetical protein n=1 Tax=Streptomyces rubiginosohelvolus TaxID=67362 RepID=UPI0036792C6E
MRTRGVIGPAAFAHAAEQNHGATTDSRRVPLHLCVQGAGAARRAGEHLVACRLGHPDGRVAAAQPEAGGRFVIAVPVIV